jgi:P2 family phage contractile tail tube protein
MPDIKINRVTNANVYLNGNSLLGQVKEMDAPEVKFMMSEHNAIGLIGKIEFPAGIDKLEGKIRWNSFYPDTLKIVASPFTAFSMQFRASLEQYGATGRLAEIPVVIYMTAQLKGLPAANFKQHDNVELEMSFGATYYKLTVGGSDVFEYDVMANILKVGGVDQLSSYRANIGG